MQIIKDNLQNIFIDLIKKAKEKIYLSSPFIKYNIAKLIIENKRDNIDCKILTKFTLPNIRWGGLDLKAIEIFNKNNIFIKNITNLHAKIFIFDNNIIVTSANLTNWGFFNNLEYWILFENIPEVEKDFLGFYNDKNYSLIKENHILNIKDIIDSLPKITKVEENTSLDENNIFLEDISLIKSKLSNWNLLTYECINNIWKNIFNTWDINNFEKLFNWKTPRNTIRRNLQELRDLWLLEFVDNNWTYRKLWI